VDDVKAANEEPKFKDVPDLDDRVDLMYVLEKKSPKECWIMPRY
jgi:hypothetical protein